MMRTKNITRTFVAFLIMAAIISISGCKSKQGTKGKCISQTEANSLRNQIKKITAANEMLAKNIATFDALDNTVLSKQQWTRLDKSHSKDLKANWSDGHFTTGLEKHIAEFSAIFVYHPDESQTIPHRFGE